MLPHGNPWIDWADLATALVCPVIGLAMVLWSGLVLARVIVAGVLSFWEREAK